MTLSRAQLERQVSDPEHCHILMATGRFFCHHETVAERWGQTRRLGPVRFTRLAADRLIEASEACRGGSKVACE